MSKNFIALFNKIQAFRDFVDPDNDAALNSIGQLVTGDLEGGSFSLNRAAMLSSLQDVYPRSLNDVVNLHVEPNSGVGGGGGEESGDGQGNDSSLIIDTGGGGGGGIPGDPPLDVEIPGTETLDPGTCQCNFPPEGDGKTITGFVPGDLKVGDVIIVGDPPNQQERTVTEILGPNNGGPGCRISVPLTIPPLSSSPPYTIKKKTGGGNINLPPNGDGTVITGLDTSELEVGDTIIVGEPPNELEVKITQLLPPDGVKVEPALTSPPLDGSGTGIKVKKKGTTTVGNPKGTIDLDDDATKICGLDTSVLSVGDTIIVGDDFSAEIQTRVISEILGGSCVRVSEPFTSGTGGGGTTVKKVTSTSSGSSWYYSSLWGWFWVTTRHPNWLWSNKYNCWVFIGLLETLNGSPYGPCWFSRPLPNGIWCTIGGGKAFQPDGTEKPEDNTGETGKDDDDKTGELDEFISTSIVCKKEPVEPGVCTVNLPPNGDGSIVTGLNDDHGLEVGDIIIVGDPPNQQERTVTEILGPNNGGPGCVVSPPFTIPPLTGEMPATINKKLVSEESIINPGVCTVNLPPNGDGTLITGINITGLKVGDVVLVGDPPNQQERTITEILTGAPGPGCIVSPPLTSPPLTGEMPVTISKKVPGDGGGGKEINDNPENETTPHNPWGCPGGFKGSKTVPENEETGGGGRLFLLYSRLWGWFLWNGVSRIIYIFRYKKWFIFPSPFDPWNVTFPVVVNMFPEGDDDTIGCTFTGNPTQLTKPDGSIVPAEPPGIENKKPDEPEPVEKDEELIIICPPEKVLEPPLPEGWYSSTHFGVYFDNYPWFYSTRWNGWWYVGEVGEDGHGNIGWIYFGTTSAWYWLMSPNIYRITGTDGGHTQSVQPGVCNVNLPPSGDGTRITGLNSDHGLEVGDVIIVGDPPNEQETTVTEILGPNNGGPGCVVSPALTEPPLTGQMPVTINKKNDTFEPSEVIDTNDLVTTTGETIDLTDGSTINIQVATEEFLQVLSVQMNADNTATVSFSGNHNGSDSRGLILYRQRAGGGFDVWENFGAYQSGLITSSANTGASAAVGQVVKLNWGGTSIESDTFTIPDPTTDPATSSTEQNGTPGSKGGTDTGVVFPHIFTHPVFGVCVVMQDQNPLTYGWFYTLRYGWIWGSVGQEWFYIQNYSDWFWFGRLTSSNSGDGWVFSKSKSMWFWNSFGTFASEGGEDYFSSGHGGFPNTTVGGPGEPGSTLPTTTIGPQPNDTEITETAANLLIADQVTTVLSFRTITDADGSIEVPDQIEVSGGEIICADIMLENSTASWDLSRVLNADDVMRAYDLHMSPHGFTGSSSDSDGGYWIGRTWGALKVAMGADGRYVIPPSAWDLSRVLSSNDVLQAYNLYLTPHGFTGSSSDGDGGYWVGRTWGDLKAGILSSHITQDDQRYQNNCYQIQLEPENTSILIF